MGNSCSIFKKKKENLSIIEIRLKNKSDILKMNTVNFNNIDKHLRIPLSYSENDVNEIYNIEIASIGEGNFSKVKLGYFKNNDYRKFAIKIISRNNIKNSLYLIANELNIIRSIDHPNIIKFYETYFNKKKIYFVTEYCEGGTLEEEIIKNNNIIEKEAVKYIFQIVLSLNHLHYRKIVHRDLKAENILFLRKNKKMIKLSDFGLSKFNQLYKLKTTVGTPYYIAPEVLSNNYDYKCDSWSWGVLIYYILSGEFPFKAKNRKELFKSIKTGKFNFKNKIWDNISKDAKDVIKKLLVVNPKNRSSISQITDHKWFNEIYQYYIDHGRNLLKKNYINKLINFSCKSNFKKEVLKLAVNLYDTDTMIINIRKSYFYLDYLNNGCITKNELIQFLKDEDLEINLEQIENLFTELNLNSDNHLTYTEYIITCWDFKEFLTEDRVIFLFSRFNTDKSDGITSKNLKECFSRFGFWYTEDKLQQLINEFDYLKNNKITLSEFKDKLLN